MRQVRRMAGALWSLGHGSLQGCGCFEGGGGACGAAPAANLSPSSPASQPLFPPAEHAAKPPRVLARRVRDDTLVALGVRLEDKPDGSSVWKLEDPAVLRAELEERRRAAAEARGKKLRAQLDSKRKVGATRRGARGGRGGGGGRRGGGGGRAGPAGPGLPAPPASMRAAAALPCLLLLPCPSHEFTSRPPPPPFLCPPCLPPPAGPGQV
jgi:hypothetical protein